MSIHSARCFARQQVFHNQYGRSLTTGGRRRDGGLGEGSTGRRHTMKRSRVEAATLESCFPFLPVYLLPCTPWRPPRRLPRLPLSHLYECSPGFHFCQRLLPLRCAAISSNPTHLELQWPSSVLQFPSQAVSSQHSTTVQESSEPPSQARSVPGNFPS